MASHCQTLSWAGSHGAKCLGWKYSNFDDLRPENTKIFPKEIFYFLDFEDINV
jgi:hypothetical protein